MGNPFLGSAALVEKENIVSLRKDYQGGPDATSAYSGPASIKHPHPNFPATIAYNLVITYAAKGTRQMALSQLYL